MIAPSALLGCPEMGLRGLHFLALFYSSWQVQNVLGGAIREAGVAMTSAIHQSASTMIRIPIDFSCRFLKGKP
jgi:hypothetical protein